MHHKAHWASDIKPAGYDVYFCEGNLEERLTNTTLVVDFP
jgi:hypothetical protein